MTSSWKTLGGWALRHGLTICAILGVLWVVVKPHAVEFVRDTVASEKFATTEALSAIDSRTRQLQVQVGQQSKSQAGLEHDVEFMKQLLIEQNRKTDILIQRSQ